MPLEDLNDLNVIKYLIMKEPATLIFFRLFANSCHVSLDNQAFFHDIVEDNDARARWIQVDVAKVPGASKFFHLKRVPTFLAVKNKEEVGRFVGNGVNRAAMIRFFYDMMARHGSDPAVLHPDLIKGLCRVMNPVVWLPHPNDDQGQAIVANCVRNWVKKYGPGSPMLVDDEDDDEDIGPMHAINPTTIHF